MSNLSETRYGDFVTIGGGSGTPVVSEALLRSGALGVTAIAAVFDNGGATGKRRENDPSELAWSDPMRILLSLFSPDLTDSAPMRALRRLMHQRSDRNEVTGHAIFNGSWAGERGFSETEQLLQDLTGMKLMGRVLPAAICSTHIKFKGKSGRWHNGERELDDNRMSQDTVVEMHLEPSCKAYNPARMALAAAKHIILSPGSLHGSVLCNFLPEGMKEAVELSKAELVYVANLFSTSNEARTPEEMIALIKQYTGRVPNTVIIPDMTRIEFENLHPGVAEVYRMDGQEWFDWNDEVVARFMQMGVRIIRHDAVDVVPAKDGVSVVRHNPARLAVALQML